MPDIYLRAGHATPADIVLRDPTTLGSANTTGTIVASQSAQSGALVGIERFRAASAVSQAVQTGSLTGVERFIAATARTQPVQTASIAATERFIAASAVSQAVQSGAAAGRERFIGTVANAQPVQTASLAGSERFLTTGNTGDLSVVGRYTATSVSNYTINVVSRGSTVELGYSATLQWAEASASPAILAGTLYRTDNANEATIQLGSIDLIAYNPFQQWEIDLEISGPPSAISVRARFWPTAIGQTAWVNANDNYALIARSDATVRPSPPAQVTEDSFAAIRYPTLATLQGAQSGLIVATVGPAVVVAETVGRRGARFDRIPDRAKVTRSVPSREVPLPSIAAIASVQPSQRSHLRAVTSDDDLAYLYLELAA